LDLNGALVTIDAIGCQKVIAKQIIDQGGDYLLAVKGNQEAFAGDIQTTVAKALDGQLAKHQVATITTPRKPMAGKRRARIVRSRIWTIFGTANSGLASPPCACVGANAPSTAQRPRKSATSSPVGAREPRKLAKATRDHWGIEINKHWQFGC